VVILLSLHKREEFARSAIITEIVTNIGRRVVRGITHYNTASGFHAVRVHYSADPEKDPDTPVGSEWLSKVLIGIPGGINSAIFRQEFEIDWDAAGGELVFPQLEPFRSKIIAAPFSVPESWSLYGSFDYGHRNPSSFHVYAIDHDGDIWAVWEYYAAGKGYRQIARAIRSCPQFDKLAYLPIADPSIWAKTQQTVNDQNEMKSIAQLFFELPEGERIVFSPGKSGGDITVAEKINGELWNTEELKKGRKPRLHIFATCPFLIWELGKLRYKDWGGSMQEYRNLQESIVDKDNHAFDDLKMFMTMFFMSPKEPEEEKLAALRTLDPVSYQEWKSVQRMHGEIQNMNATGEESDEIDYDEID
jgi:hypothetical protein